MTLVEYIVSIDTLIAQTLNHFATQDTTTNKLLALFSGNNFIKMAPFICMAAWFWNRTPHEHNRRIIISGLAGIFIAFFIGRILQVSLPFRLRPIHAPELNLLVPPGFSAETLGGWSSLPSDHAAIFAALAGLAFALSRRAGMVATVYVAVFVLFPRIYFGEHYLSDVLVGTAIGELASYITLRTSIGAAVAGPLDRMAIRFPAPFYAVAMLFVAQLIQMFADVRMYGSVLKGLIQGTL